MFSPDGAWIAYSSSFSGRAEVYVQPFPGPGARVQISPLWSRDGRELIYGQCRLSEGSSRLMRLPVASNASENPGFQAGAPQVLMDNPFTQGTPVRASDISLDGKRLLTSQLAPGEERGVSSPRDPRAPGRRRWTSELARLVP